MALSKTAVLDLERDSSQYVSIANADQTGLNLTGSSTIMCWLNPESLPSVNGVRHTIVSKYDASAGGYEICVQRTSGSNLLEVITRQDGSTVDTNTATLVALRALTGTGWCHLAVVIDYSGGTLALTYLVDGIVTGTDTGSTTAMGTTTAEFAIGSRSGGSNYWDGLVSDVKVFSAALTTDQVISNMRHYRNTANIQGNWRLDNSYFDSSDNTNHLTDNGSTAFSSASLPFETYGRTTRFFAGPGDGQVAFGAAGWDTTHDSATGSAVDDTSNTLQVLASKPFSSSSRTIRRAFLPFDTSGLDEDLQVIGGAVGYVPSAVDASTTIGVVQTTQSDPTNLTTADYSKCGSVDSPTEGGTRYTPDSTDADLINWVNLNSTGTAWIDIADYTLLGFRIARDLDDTDFTGSSAQEDSQTIRTSETSSTTSDPFLDVIDDDQYYGGSTDEGGSGGGAGDGGGVDLGGGSGAPAGEYVPPTGGGGSGGANSPAAAFLNIWIDS